jgi:hypothetical protein
VFEREHPAAAAYTSRLWNHAKLFTEMDEELSKHGKCILWDKYLVDMDVPF